MKLHYKILLSIILLLLNVFLLFSQKGDEVTLLPLKVGVAKVNITPKAMMPLAGYSERVEPATGIRDSLYAVVMVFNDGKKQVAIVSLDLIFVLNSEARQIYQAIENVSGMRSGNIIMNVSHTHGSPLLGTDDSYRNEVVAKVATAVKIASVRLHPVSIGYGEGEVTFNVNRRDIDENGKCITRLNPGGLCDHRVKVLRIDDSNSISPMAVIFHVVCHANVFRYQNRQVTADFPGLAKTFIEQNFKNTTAMFLQGCTGDVRPYMPDMDGQINGFGRNGSEADITWCGWSTGAEVTKIATGLRVYEKLARRTEDFTIVAVSDTIALGINTLKLTERAKGHIVDGKINLPVKAIKIGSIYFLGLPGEPVVEYGLKIERRLKEMGLGPVFVLGYMDGDIGYIPAKHMFKEGGYETEGPFLPSCEKKIINGVAQLVERLIKDAH